MQAEPQRTGVQEKTAACFDAPSHYEVTVEGRKLIGSAQMRRKGMVLQHGSLPLCGDITRIMKYLCLPSEERRSQLRDDLRRRATTLKAALGRTVPFEEVVAAFAESLARSLNLDLVPAALTPYEEELMVSLRREKYDTTEWNLQR